MDPFSSSAAFNVHKGISASNEQRAANFKGK
jgi:hypothetical protein